jgi:hypothetical protein
VLRATEIVEKKSIKTEGEEYIVSNRIVDEDRNMGS